ncbi:MAG: alkaline phosphatase PhoX [Candidatus Thiodiazotropha sp.]
MLQKKSLRKSDLAIALSVAMLGMTFGLTGCNNDNNNNDDNQTTSSQTVEEQIAALNTDDATKDVLRTLAAEALPIGFMGVDAPISDSDKRAIMAAPYAILQNGGTNKVSSIGFHTILRSGEFANASDPFAFGQIVDESGNAVLGTDSSPDISNSNDFASLLPVGDSLYMVSHFEDRPAAMYLTELNQDAQTGLLTALRTRPLDFSAYKGGWVHCAGSVTPWNTHLGSEEYEPDASAWDAATGEVNDYYNAIASYFAGGLTETHPYRYGYQVEVAVSDYDNATVTKHYTMGRVAHELAYVMPDRKTVYISDDGTDVGLFMFVADTAGDLSSGHLYVAKWQQTSDTNGGTANLSWVDLGAATDTQIQTALNSNVRYEYLFNEVDVNEDGSCADGFTKVDHTYGKECLQLREGNFAGVPIATLASRLETRRYASYLGGTTEFRKMEGITHNPDDNKLYIAMSEVASGMAAGDREAPLSDDIQLPENKCGTVYQLDLTDDSAASGSGYMATRMSGLISGIPTTYDANSPYFEKNTCDIDGLANPDNVTYMPGYGTLIIGEDTGSGHQNDAIWAYNLAQGSLTRIQTTPYGSETTSPYFYPNINGFAYLMSVVQHPYGESDEDQLGDVNDARAYTGYIGPFPAMD